jgi:hypothetical protein
MTDMVQGSYKDTASAGMKPFGAMNERIQASGKSAGDILDHWVCLGVIINKSTGIRMPRVYRAIKIACRKSKVSKRQLTRVENTPTVLKIIGERSRYTMRWRVMGGVDTPV